MAMKIETRLEHEATEKGLDGEKRTHWIGGAWNRIRDAEHRSSWRHSEEAKLLSRYYGPVHDIRQRARSRFGLQVAEQDQDHVMIRQGHQWYDLPRSEYQNLIKASQEEVRRESLTARQLAREDERERARIEREIRASKAAHEREQKRAQAAREHAERERTKGAERAARAARAREQAEARAIAQYERALATEKRQEEQKRVRLERQEAAFRAQQERDLHRMEREQYADVLAVIRHSGGIKPSVSHQGTKYDRGEYDTLPSTVRSGSGRLTMDDAARDINTSMPHLGIHTTRDLVDYFDRHRTRGYTLHKQSSSAA